MLTSKLLSALSATGLSESPATDRVVAVEAWEALQGAEPGTETTYVLYVLASLEHAARTLRTLIAGATGEDPNQGHNYLLPPIYDERDDG